MVIVRLPQHNLYWQLTHEGFWKFGSATKGFFYTNASTPHPSGWWKRRQTKLQRDGMMGPFSYVFFLFPKAGSKRKVVTQTEERMAVCYHWEQPVYLRLVLGRPLFCYHWPGFPRFLKRFAEVTTASLQMSRDLGLEGRAREVDSKHNCEVFSKLERFQIKGKSKCKNHKKNASRKNRSKPEIVRVWLPTLSWNKPMGLERCWGYGTILWEDPRSRR